MSDPSAPDPVPGDDPVVGQSIEIGWLIFHPLDKISRIAVLEGRARMLAWLQQRFGQFDWRMPVIQRNEPILQQQEEPVRLLKEGMQERTHRHWDFVFVITRTDLHTYYKPFAFAVSSRAINGAVISTARMEPEQEDPHHRNSSVGSDETQSFLAQRVAALGMHLLGDLTGLSHRDERDAFMHPPETAEELEHMQGFSEEETSELAGELSDIADTRLEEEPQSTRTSVIWFYLRACWRGWDDIYRAVVRARPWQFPYRLSRLTTAALSTLLILLITAEAWDLGMSQPWERVVVLSVGALLGTTLYILLRQQLLLHRGRGRPTEQLVFTNVSVSIVIFLGMSTTYLMLFALVWVLSLALFNGGLVTEWAASIHESIRWHHYLVLAGFVASLGILIGALGASFEDNLYFQHITYVDEET